MTEESLMERLTTDMPAACRSINQNCRSEMTIILFQTSFLQKWSLIVGCSTYSIICRVLTVHGSMDKTVPVEDAFDFNKIIPNHKVSIVEGADHEHTSHQNELASIVLDFIKEDFLQDKFIHSRF